MTNLTNNQILSRFELERAGHLAYADYGIDGDILVIRFVFAPEELRGTGAAGDLMAAIVDHAMAQNLKIRPICGYAAAWLRKHPEFTDFVA